MALLASDYGAKLPTFTEANTLLAFSDYSGEEAEAPYSVYSFLIISDKNLTEWDKSRAALRQRLLPDNRRVSYKKYRDALSKRFINEYLKVANSLDGYLITVSVSKQVETIFDGKLDFQQADLAPFAVWTTDTTEKTLRILHLISLFIAGFSRMHQNFVWITDNDKIAANPERLSVLVEALSRVSSSYLNHSLGHLRVGTTNVDDGTRLVEDLCSIPDLVAGAYSDQLKTMAAAAYASLSSHFWIHSPVLQQKTNAITWWASTSPKNLCKLYFKISSSEEDKQRVQFFHFYNK